MNADALFFTGFVAGAGIVPVAWGLFRMLTVSVRENEAVLLTRFGRLSRTLTQAGLHQVPERILPWVQLRRVSLRRDFLMVNGVNINDRRGTTVVVDIWIELRVVDAARSCFAVQDWEVALRDLVGHSAGAILAEREFAEILSDRTELGERLRAEILEETTRWGLSVEGVYLRKVSLLPDVAQRMFTTVAAKLERKKADIDEEGHQRVALLEAETATRTAVLEARAKGQYPAAVGRAYGKLRATPKVLSAYEELYRLAQLRPHRVLAFHGFAPGELRPSDAAMLDAEMGPSNGHS